MKTIADNISNLKKVIDNYQTFNHPYKTEVPLESYHLSKIQEKYYKEALYGINSYPEKVLSNMSDFEKKRISNIYRKAQFILNLWKQEILIEKTNKIFSIFKCSPLAEEIISQDKANRNFICMLSFKELGIKKQDIINKLISEKILPSNFLTLKENVKICTLNV
jgi:hypothetical protein